MGRRLLLAAGLGLPPLVLFGWMIFGHETLGRDYVVLPTRGALTFRSYTDSRLDEGGFRDVRTVRATARRLG